PAGSALFPYTTLFRSLQREVLRVDQVLVIDGLDARQARAPALDDARLRGREARAPERDVLPRRDGEGVHLAQQLVVAHREQIEIEPALPVERLDVVPGDDEAVLRDVCRLAGRRHRPLRGAADLLVVVGAPEAAVRPAGEEIKVLAEETDAGRRLAVDRHGGIGA